MRLVAGLLVMGLLAAAPRLAVAEDDDRARAAEANKHFQLGVQLYSEQKFSEALIEFQRAYEIFPHPSVLYNIAVTHRDLSQYDEAIQFYERFLAEAPGKVPDERLDQARKELDELRARVGTITVIATPDGSVVTVDGREVGETPLARPLVLGPGHHTIEVRGPSGRVETRTITLAAGDQARVDVDVWPVDRGGGGGGDGGGTTIVKRARRGGRFGVSASVGTNARQLADTGAPVLGVALPLGGRVTAGVEVVLVAYAVVPSVRVRLAGGKLSAHALAALPVTLTDEDGGDPFVAGAVGLGARYWLAPKIAARVEAWVSFAGGDHGVTVPAFAGVEVWF